MAWLRNGGGDSNLASDIGDGVETAEANVLPSRRLGRSEKKGIDISGNKEVGCGATKLIPGTGIGWWVGLEEYVEKPAAEEGYMEVSLKEAPDPAAELMMPGIPVSPNSLNPATLKYEWLGWPSNSRG